MNKLLGDQEEIQSQQQQTYFHQINSFQNNKQTLWSRYLNQSKMEQDTKFNQSHTNISQFEISNINQTSLEINQNKKIICQNKIEKSKQVFNRLYYLKNNLVNRSTTEYSFSPVINKNSLKILENCKNKIKKQKAQSFRQQQKMNKSFTLQKSKQLCYQKFNKQINAVIKFMSQKLQFSGQKKQFNLEQTFYILTGLKYIKYNSKMEAFIQKQQNLVRKMWELLSHQQFISKQILVHFLMHIEGISNKIKEKFQFKKQQYDLFYYNRLNYGQNTKNNDEQDLQLFNPRILEKSKQLTKQYRRKKGLSMQITQFDQVLQFYQIKQQQHKQNILKLKQTKQNKQIQECTFKPKTTPKSNQIQCLYNKPQKKRQSYYKKPDLIVQTQNQNIKPIINKVKTPSCVHQMPKSYNKQVFRMRTSLMEKQKQNQKFKIGKQKSNKLKNPLIVDVDINSQLSQKLKIYDLSQIDSKVDAFSQKYNIQRAKRDKIKQIIKQQMKNLKPRINFR